MATITNGSRISGQRPGAVVRLLVIGVLAVILLCIGCEHRPADPVGELEATGQVSIAETTIFDQRPRQLVFVTPPMWVLVVVGAFFGLVFVGGAVAGFKSDKTGTGVCCAVLGVVVLLAAWNATKTHTVKLDFAERALVTTTQRWLGGQERSAVPFDRIRGIRVATSETTTREDDDLVEIQICELTAETATGPVVLIETPTQYSCGDQMLRGLEALAGYADGQLRQAAPTSSAAAPAATPPLAPSTR